MIKDFATVVGGLSPLRLPFALNCAALFLRGAPLGILFVVVAELAAKGRDASPARLWAMAAVMFALLAAYVLVSAAAHTRAFVTAYGLVAAARIRLAGHLKDLPLSFFKTRDPGDVTANLLQDMGRVETVLSHLLVDLSAALLLPALLAVGLFAVDWRLAGLMVGCVAAAAPLVLWAHRWVGRLGGGHVAAQNAVLLHMLEFLEGIKDLKANNVAGARFARIEAAMRRNRDLSVALETAGAVPLLLFRAVLDFGFVAMMLLAVHLLAAGRLAPAACILFLVVGQRFFEPLHLAGSFSTLVRFMSLAAGRIASVLALPPLAVRGTPAAPHGADLEFDGVAFAYGTTPVLADVGFRAPSGTVTALVGPSGGGKTTLAGLAARFWDVGSGSVRLGGADVRDIAPGRLYADIAMVFQDVYLFDDTVENNLRLGRPDAPFTAVREAAMQANCLEFIERLDQGWQTRVGEGGCRLSGGERQRISIARAILKDAPVVLLDEATASLDPQNALAVQTALARLARGRTVLVIAHRLASIAGADQILVLDGGRVVARGRHEALLAAGGLYKTLWDDQETARRWQIKEPG
ncbi:MAG TPA: ABC transporter ATP-binding protein [Solidesulfovibrio magneticus]|nr:ABC transporter ATP-binding protein [Solidesulfovibrio magneticus]